VEQAETPSWFVLVKPRWHDHYCGANLCVCAMQSRAAARPRFESITMRIDFLFGTIITALVFAHPTGAELSPNLGDGRDQAAAI
jgi:hypothetical protein